MPKVIVRFVFTWVILISFAAFAAEPNYDSIADKVVKQSLQVQPGEVVIITGGVGEIKLMEAIFIAVSKVGGQPVVQLNLPEAAKRATIETPIEHLKHVPTFALLQARAADCFINVTSVQDPKLFADVPEERLAAARQAAAPLNEALRHARFRSVTLGQTGGIPTEAYAKSQAADYNQMVTMFWKAIDVSPDDLAARGNKIAGKLKAGSIVHMKSKQGTDLKFKISLLPARINAGRAKDVVTTSGPSNAWLPAGEAYAVVDPSSASGTVVVPYLSFRGIPITNIRLTFKDGTMSAVTADSQMEVLQKFFDSSDSKLKNLTIVDIGLNPNSQPLPHSRYLSWEMGGIVSLNMGNNAWAGGDNDSDAAFAFQLPATTLSVGEEVIVQDGVLRAN